MHGVAEEARTSEGIRRRSRRLECCQLVLQRNHCQILRRDSKAPESGFIHNSQSFAEVWQLHFIASRPFNRPQSRPSPDRSVKTRLPAEGRHEDVLDCHVIGHASFCHGRTIAAGADAAENVQKRQEM